MAGITNVAPSTSIALSLGAIIAVSGLASPAVVWTVGLAMLCIAISYHYLNLWRPSAAAQAVWIARTIRPVAGLAIGFAVILMTLVANIGNITLFGPYLLGIIYPSHQNSAILQWLCTAVATGLVLYIAIEGVRRAIRFQTVIVWIEYAIVVAFVIALLVAEYSGHPGTVHPHLSWLLPTTSPTFHGFLNGVVIGVFMYGGWEASVYLAEEGTDTKRNPGRAGIISVVFCIIWFTILTMAIQAIAPAKDLVANAGNIIAYSASVIWPKPWSSIVSLAVLSSVIAVTQSQLQNFSRMSFGLSRDGLLPSWLGGLAAPYPRPGSHPVCHYPGHGADHLPCEHERGQDHRAGQRNSWPPLHRDLRSGGDRVHLVSPAEARVQRAPVHPGRRPAVHRWRCAGVCGDRRHPDDAARNSLSLHRDVRPAVARCLAGQVLHQGSFLRPAGAGGRRSRASR